MAQESELKNTLQNMLEIRIKILSNYLQAASVCEISETENPAF